MAKTRKKMTLGTNKSVSGNESTVAPPGVKRLQQITVMAPPGYLMTNYQSQGWVNGLVVKVNIAIWEAIFKKIIDSGF